MLLQETYVPLASKENASDNLRHTVCMIRIYLSLPGPPYLPRDAVGGKINLKIES